jgi:acetylornithine deacetylase/succinyl-diaminopimelate desuccinylase-like protein
MTRVPPPAELLQQLIRFNTTNPPGHEAACINYLAEVLQAHGIEAHTYAKDPARPNLIARLGGRGDAPPLLLQGHIDVVTTEGQQWANPPFDGAILPDDNGAAWVWGRGALDMKSGIVMLLSALLRAKAEGVQLPGDLIFCALADEEAGSDYGAKYMVQHHAAQFSGVKYALGEFGGFSVPISGRTFYPIMLGERTAAPITATLRGPGGHGARVYRGGAMAKLGRMLLTLDSHTLPIHITPIVARMIDTIADTIGGAQGDVIRLLQDPTQADAVLATLGDAGNLIQPLLRNTINATMVRGGHKINVIPSEITLQLDARLLPGIAPRTLLDEVRAIVGDDPELTFQRDVTNAASVPDLKHFDTLAAILREADPDGTPLPYVVSGSTDASIFAQLGIQTYGFLPMRLPSDFRFANTIHAADERIPVSALEFGCAAVYQAVQRIGA